MAQRNLKFKINTKAIFLIGCIALTGIGITGFYISEKNQIAFVQSVLESLFQGDELSDFEDLLDSSILNILPSDFWLYLVTDMNIFYGSFQNVSVSRINQNSYSYAAYFGNASFSGTISFVSWNQKINGFYYRNINFYPEYLASLEWDTIYGEFESLPGDNALLVVKDNVFTHSYHADSRLNVASSFKLFVLKALYENITNTVGGSWDTQVAVRDEWKSLPSGILHTKPAGTVYTLKQLADLMISISDNTATDHIINYLGRDYVESFLPEMYERPLVKTGDMFKLRYLISDSDLNLYLAMSESEKRTYLDTTIYGRSISEININNIDWTHNLDKRKQIGWTFNATEMFTILNETKSISSTQINPGFANPNLWKTIAYKGGGDVGIYSLCEMMENSEGTWCGYIMIGNNFDNIFFDYGEFIYHQLGYNAISQKLTGKLALEL